VRNCSETACFISLTTVLDISPYLSFHASANSSSLDVVERFDTYENYLDSQLTVADMNYLEDDEMARQLVELGYRGLGDTIRRDVRIRSQLLRPEWNVIK
jgi:Domain of unknown function (DUF4464)